MVNFYTLILSVLVLFQSASLPDESVTGTYIKELGGPEHHFIYTLHMNEDGTFKFHYREDFSGSKRVNPGVEVRVKENYGRGTWKLDGKIVSFSTDPSSVNSDYQLDFGGNKARFDFKSPRDKSDRVIPTTLRFFESDIFWMVGITMTKQ